MSDPLALAGTFGACGLRWPLADDSAFLAVWRIRRVAKYVSGKPKYKALREGLT
jgi:hypothetical protein